MDRPEIWMRSLAVSLGAAILALLCLGGSAQAAFPGDNGEIAYSAGPQSSPSSDVFAADGAAAFRTTITTGAYARHPAWSPDGTKIAYSESTDIYVANPDGSAKTLVLDWDSTAWDLDWSPDGTKLVAELWTCDPDAEPPCTQDIYTMNIDGTDLTNITGGDPSDDRYPAWSPDGSKIAFSSWRDGGIAGIFTMNPDGSNVTRITTGAHYNADWSPDGQRLVFTCCWDDHTGSASQVLIVNADGTNAVFTERTGQGPSWSPDGAQIAIAARVPPPLEHTAIWLFTPGTPTSHDRIVARPHWSRVARDTDWRPRDLTVAPAHSGYPRPKGTEPLRISYVIAYRECTAPNRTHGAPLAFGSCNPPQQESNTATVGTPDVNGFPAQSSGHLWMKVLRGDPVTPADEADVRIESSITDVRWPSAAPWNSRDFQWHLSIRLPLRVTDKGSTGPDASATVTDFSLGVPMSCDYDADDSIGSHCSVATTVEALVPGAAKEGRRAIWEIGKIQVYDGGPPSSDGTWFWRPFVTQGVFIP